MKAKNIAKITGFFLPPANEVFGKVMCGCGGCAWLPGGHAWLWGVWLPGWGSCVVVEGMHGWGVCCCGGA